MAADAPEWYRDLLPGEVFLAELADDPGYLHCRVCLWPVSSDVEGGLPLSFTVLTPGLDTYEELISDYNMVLWRLRSGRCG